LTTGYFALISLIQFAGVFHGKKSNQLSMTLHRFCTKVSSDHVKNADDHQPQFRGQKRDAAALDDEQGGGGENVSVALNSIGRCSFVPQSNSQYFLLVDQGAPDCSRCPLS